MREPFGLLRETVVRVQCEDLGTTGSGFIISTGGLVLTCFSAIGREGKHKQYHLSSKIEVQLDVGMFCAAKIVSDPRSVGPDPIRFDFAVLQIESSALPYLKLGSAALVQPGDEVAFGGYASDSTRVTAHRGLVAGKFDASALRLKDSLEGAQVIDVDGVTRAGYAGGPVFNPASGQVVGMISARVSTPDGGLRAIAIDHALQFLKTRSIRFGNLTDRTLF
jgi:hypothetical protein